jgi:hypothetical protein
MFGLPGLGLSAAHPALLRGSVSPNSPASDMKSRRSMRAMRFHPEFERGENTPERNAPARETNCASTCRERA